MRRYGYFRILNYAFLLLFSITTGIALAAQNENYKVVNGMAIYLATAAHGHLGRMDAEFTWEQIDKTEILRDDAGI